MNPKQKALTVIFLITFSLTFLLFPWVSPYEAHDHVASPIWLDPIRVYSGKWVRELEYHRDWILAGVMWMWMVVVYFGLFYILKPTSR
jgi:hypothetical protein